MVRIVSGLLLSAVFVVLIWFASATVLLAVALGVGALAVHEFVQLYRQLGSHVPAVPTLLVTWAATVMLPFPYVTVEAVVSIGLIVIAIWVMAAVSPQPGKSFAEAARGGSAAVLGAVYIGLGLGSLVAVHVYGGRGAVLLVMATIVISDTAQYFTGRAFGRRPLAIQLSPKKTIEGAAGGFIVAPAFFVWASYYLLPMASNQIVLVAVGVALVIAGIAGDLFESTLKRAAGVKDSSALIPGHGGVLDRIDALLFASPVFFVYVRTLFS